MKNTWLMKLVVLVMVVIFAAACGKNMAMGGCEEDDDCPVGQVCASGFCADDDADDDDEGDNEVDPRECSDSETLCDGECVDTSQDMEHCGACNAACLSGGYCVDGYCEAPAPCEQTELYCEDECIDPLDDDEHCGQCGVVCDEGEACEMGECMPQEQPDCDPEAEPFGGGVGQADDPYQICTADHLRAVDDHLSDHFQLASDVDMAGESIDVLADYTGSFGEWEDVFTGHFDGLGHEIENLTIESGDESAVGLFGVSDGGTFANLSVHIERVEGDRYVGAVVGINEGTIEDVDVEIVDEVAGEEHVGGITGYNGAEAVILDTQVTSPQLDAPVVVGMNRVGGLVGESRGLIDGVFSNASVVGNSLVGGLVGEMDGGETCELSNAEAEGDVYGEGEEGFGAAQSRHVGGLVGRNQGDCEIIDSHASGDVPAETTEEVGGLVGRNSAVILRSSSESAVWGTFRVGGLVGENRDEIRQSLATGMVENTGNSTGGLVGRLHSDGEVIDSYATGTVSGTFATGGLVGAIIQSGGGWGSDGETSSGQVSTSYSVGVVEGGGMGPGGGGSVGGLVGLNEEDDFDDNLFDSYWNVDSSTLNESDGGHRLNDEQFGEQDNFDGFDFDEVWTMGAERPLLQWQ